MEVNASARVVPGKNKKVAGKELNAKQKKIWVMIFYSLLLLIIGLIIAIMVVMVNNRERQSNCSTKEEITEDKRKENEQRKIVESYNEIHETIDKIIEATKNLEESDVINAYLYYIGETEDETVKNMLRMQLLSIEMGYDTEKVRGDELIDIAVEVDSEMQTSNSAALVMSLASNYDKMELYNEYEAIFNERLIAEGYNPNEETKG